MFPAAVKGALSEAGSCRWKAEVPPLLPGAGSLRDTAQRLNRFIQAEFLKTLSRFGRRKSPQPVGAGGGEPAG